MSYDGGLSHWIRVHGRSRTCTTSFFLCTSPFGRGTYSSACETLLLLQIGPRRLRESERERTKIGKGECTNTRLIQR